MPRLPEGVVLWLTYYTLDTVCESYYVTLRKSKTLVYIVSKYKPNIFSSLGVSMP